MSGEFNTRDQDIIQLLQELLQGVFKDLHIRAGVIMAVDEIKRLRLMLATFIHAHETATSVPPFIEKEAKELCRCQR